MTNKVTIEGTFSQEQLEELRAMYSSVERVDPFGPAMTKLNQLIGSLADESIEMVIAAKIKWVSSKARTEKILRMSGSSLA